MHAARTGAHFCTVLGECLGSFGRVALEQECSTCRTKAITHRGPEQYGVRPLRDDSRRAVAALRMKAGRWLAMLQHVTDERRVAINVRADLQQRCSPIATRKRQ